MITKISTAGLKYQIKSLLLSAILICLAFCSISVVAQANDYQMENKPTYTLKIVTHGEDDNRSDNMSEQGRQDNRRTDVKMKATVQKGDRIVEEESVETVQVKVSDAINRTIKLADGGVIWVSKDPASLTPVLNVTAPQSVEMKSGEFDSPMNFEINTNYASFIDKWELQVFHADDEQQKKPLATFMGRSLENGRTLKWNGTSKSS